LEITSALPTDEQKFPDIFQGIFGIVRDISIFFSIQMLPFFAEPWQTFYGSLVGKRLPRYGPVC